MTFPVSENMKKAVDSAHDAAMRYSNPVIGTEHMLYGLVTTEGSLAGQLLLKGGLRPETLEKIFEESDHVSQPDVDLTPRVKQTFMIAQRLSQSNGGTFVGTEHFLFCMLQDPTSFAYSILASISTMNIGGILEKLQEAIGGGRTDAAGTSASGGNALPAQLSDLGIDLTQRAREHKIDPVIGRKEEIERIIQILCRKTKNNPVLIGEPGVGKSAVVEGLSKAIVEGNVPELLKNKIVFSLDLGSLMAGTKYRGALEEKLKNAIDLIKSQQNIIVFIDELHTLAQAGSKEGEVSPADILKPYLARGEMQTIGATTTDEYRKFIETDKALEQIGRAHV